MTEQMTDQQVNDTIELNFRDHLEEGYKDKFPEIQDVNGLMKSYEGLVTKMGTNPIVRPGENADDLAREEYFQTLAKEMGRPDDVDGYQMPEIADMPEGFVDNDLMDELKKVAHENGVSGAAFEKMAAAYLSGQMNKYTQTQNESSQAYNDAIEAMKKEWGADYEKNLNATQAFIKTYTGEEDKAVFDKFGNDPDFIKMMHTLQSKQGEDRGLKHTGSTARTPEELRTQGLELMKQARELGQSDPQFDALYARARECYALADKKEGQ